MLTFASSIGWVHRHQEKKLKVFVIVAYPTNIPLLARTNMVSETSSNVGRHTCQTSNIKQNSARDRIKSRALKEQRLGNLRLEGLWKSRIRCLPWNKHAFTRTVNSLADSTLRSYNVYNFVNKRKQTSRMNTIIAYCQNFCVN